MKHSTIEIYARGICHSSVCAPASKGHEEIERLANIYNPTGIESKWKVSKDPHFADGTINGCFCETWKADSSQPKKHWLLVC